MYDETVKNNQKDQNDDDNDNNDVGITKDQAKQIKDLGSITPADGRHPIHCLTIVGEIEGHYVLPPQTKTTRYEHVIPQLIAIEEDPGIKGLLVVLNTVGGDVEAGLAIAELISGMKKPTVSLVLGGGHSIGAPLAVATKKSFIVPSATMTIHPVRTNGLVLGVSQTLNYFNKMQERITGFIVDNSNITEEKFTSLMLNTGELTTDMGTVLKGQDAVDVGLIDSMGKLSDAIAHLYAMIDEAEKANKDNNDCNQDNLNKDNSTNEENQ